MSILKRFLKDTIIYGLATVIPRLANVFLVGLHTDTLETDNYSKNTLFYVYIAFLNVFLTYGMETAFFRFFNKSEDKSKVFSTALISLTTSAILFFALAWGFKESLANLAGIDPLYLQFLLGVLLLDTLVVVPFAYLRATNRPIRFTAVKLSNLFVYVLLNVFFLWAIPKFKIEFPDYSEEHQEMYIFIANLAASAITLLLMLPYFFKDKLIFDSAIFKKLLAYGWPIMVAGIAFVINENLDKLLIKEWIDEDTMGAYAGCYKLAVFMMIFIQAFKLGAEPFFFSHAKEKNATTTYATILKYFTITGASGLVFIVAYLDFFKELLIRDESYWIAIEIVPVILLANLCLGIYHNLSIWYKLTDKTRYGMYISILGAIITIAFNWIMIDRIGIMASAWATLAAYGGMMLISYLLGKKHYPVPYQVGRIAFYLILASGISYLSFMYYRENLLVNTALVFVFLGIVFSIERKELISILKRK